MDEQADVGAADGTAASEVEASRGARLRSSLLRLGLAMVAVAVVGAMSGYLFARSSPDRAAATRIAAFVQIEPAAASDDEVPSRDPAAPSSGAARGDGGCGERDAPLDPEAQVAALAAGRVLVQYRPQDVDPAAVADLRPIVAERPRDVLLAPNPDLANPVVATAWSRRLPLRAVDVDLVDGFVTAYAGGGPEPAPCLP